MLIPKPNPTISLIKKCFRLRLKKQKMLIRILFLYNRVELNILLLYLKDFSSLEKLFFATIIKIKIAKNKVIRKTLTIDLLKSNKIAIIIKNCKYTQMQES
jgi:hypothetical protein